VDSAATSSHYPFENGAPEAGDPLANLINTSAPSHCPRVAIEAIWTSRNGRPGIWLPRTWPTSAQRATSSGIAPPQCGLDKTNVHQLGGAIFEAGLMDAAKLERYRLILDLPDCFYPASMAMISVWGGRQLA
jgi:hypothetical protein